MPDTGQCLDGTHHERKITSDKSTPDEGWVSSPTERKQQELWWSGVISKCGEGGGMISSCPHIFCRRCLSWASPQPYWWATRREQLYRRNCTDTVDCTRRSRPNPSGMQGTSAWQQSKPSLLWATPCSMTLAMEADSSDYDISLFWSEVGINYQDDGDSLDQCAGDGEQDETVTNGVTGLPKIIWI